MTDLTSPDPNANEAIDRGAAHRPEPSTDASGGDAAAGEDTNEPSEPSSAAVATTEDGDGGATSSPAAEVSDAAITALAHEFSIGEDNVRFLVAALGDGLVAPYLGRFQREATGIAQEGLVRRFEQRLGQLAELDRRRGTIVRTLEGVASNDDGRVPQSVLRLARTTVDRHVLEDLYLPYRKPEPEVQLALDRGLGGLADELAKPGPRPAAKAGQEHGEGTDDDADESEGAADGSSPAAQAQDVHGADDAADEGHAADADGSEGAGADVASAGEATTGEAAAVDAGAAPEADGAAEGEADADASSEKKGRDRKGAGPAPEAVPEPALEFTPELARACQPFVSPDRDVHTDRDALEGAMRVLADRLGRDPQLRAQLRVLMRKHAVVRTRPGSNDERGKRHRAVQKLDVPLRQLQGPRLLALRQAQRERAVHVAFVVDERRVLPKVKAALARRPHPDYEGVLDTVAWQAWTRRLRPVLEEDLRVDLAEHAEEEATRLVVGQVRHVLMGPMLGPRPVAGLDVDARGDWTVVAVDEQGAPQGPEVRIATAGKSEVDLAEELAAALRPTGVRWLALSNGRGAKEALAKVRQAVALSGAEAVVTVVEDAGLSAYANSELARKELAELSVPARVATSIARRLQDPMAELLKVDTKSWGVGLGTAILTKSAGKRVLRDAIQSCVCTVGVDVSKAPPHLVTHLPGFDPARAARLVELRDAGALGSRDALVTSGLLDPTQARNVAAFLRFPDSPEPLDRSSLHPEQYELARRLVEATGRPFEEVYGRQGGTKGLKRSDFGLDEATWRDLVRELSQPGRDPRPRLFPPRLLPPGTTSEQLEKGQVVEGIVTTVTNFGAFVDLGVDRDGLVHVSRVSKRFVRDAREAASVGQVVRAVVLDASGPRIALSIKDAPEPERRARGPRPGGGERPERSDRGERGERRGGARRPRGEEAWPQPQRLTRVARTRRDGMPGDEAGAGRGAGRGGRGPGGGGGGGRGAGGGRGPGGGRGDRRGDRGDRGEAGREDLAALTRKGGEKSGYNPFASFFKEKKGDEPSGEGQG